MERSLLSGAAVATRVIPAGIDLDNFKPGDRSRARTELGLPLEAQILLFAAAKVKTNPWKDHRTIEATLRQIAETYRGRQLVFLALGEDAQTERFGSVELRYVPFTRDPARLTMFYQATDLYVHAALVDTFPNTVLEAMACGIPVVASAVGTRAGRSRIHRAACASPRPSGHGGRSRSIACGRQHESPDGPAGCGTCPASLRPAQAGPGVP